MSISGAIWRDCLDTDPKLGGGLRSRQVAELVNDLVLPWVDLCTKRIRRPVADVLGSWGLCVADPSALHTTARMRRRVANRLREMELLAEQFGFPKCILWENTRDHTSLLFARRYGVPIIALPHNLEALVSLEQVRYSQSGKHARFEREVALLAQADAVFAISTWDQWLLGLFDVQSELLMYRPPRQRLPMLDKVRAHRADTEASRDHVLVLGTAHYEPTRVGMTELVEQIETLVVGSGLNVIVAGAGTENLTHLASSSIQVLGTVDADVLLDLYRRAYAGVVYQRPASGALTRIPDLLAAGVPVLANTYAARSQQDQPGLSVFVDSYDLRGKLGCISSQTVKYCFRDHSEAVFQQCLRDTVASD